MRKLSPGSQGDLPKGTEISISFSAFLLQDDVSWSSFGCRLRSLGMLEQECSEVALSRTRHKQYPKCTLWKHLHGMAVGLRWGRSGGKKT